MLKTMQTVMNRVQGNRKLLLLLATLFLAGNVGAIILLQDHKVTPVASAVCQPVEDLQGGTSAEFDSLTTTSGMSAIANDQKANQPSPIRKSKSGFTKPDSWDDPLNEGEEGGDSGYQKPGSWDDPDAPEERGGDTEDSGYQKPESWTDPDSPEQKQEETEDSGFDKPTSWQDPFDYPEELLEDPDAWMRPTYWQDPYRSPYIEQDTVCENELPYTWLRGDGTTAKLITAEGIYADSLQTTFGCDSILYIQLTVMPMYDTLTIDTICRMQLPYIWHEKEYNQTGLYVDSLTTIYGCDSLTSLSLYVTTVLENPVYDTICHKELPYVWTGHKNDTALYITGTYTDSLVSSAGCDSVVILYLTVNEESASDNIVDVCTVDMPYMWQVGAKTIQCDSAGTYVDTTANIFGCDSVCTIHLQIHVPDSTDTIASVCDVDLPFYWYNAVCEAAGDYTYTTQNIYNCDSLITLHLSVYSASAGDTSAMVCKEEYNTYTWHGIRITKAGDYVDTILNAHGCDSIVTLHVTEAEKSYGDTLAKVCTNDFPFIWHGITCATEGTYKDTILNYAGCDSIVTLTVKNVKATTGTEKITICESELPYTWHSIVCDRASMYMDTLVNANGCDSVVRLTLITKRSEKKDTAATRCLADLPYLWRGNSCDSTGQYTAVLKDETGLGCDTILRLNFKVLMASHSDTTDTVCSDQLPYTWYAHSITKDTTVRTIFPSSAKCDSVVTFHLVVHDTAHVEFDTTVCPRNLPVLWNRMSLTASGTYRFDSTTMYGCDSVTILNLTLLPDATDTLRVTIRDGESYTWNSKDYTIRGTYVDTLPAANTCDSLDVLILTVWGQCEPTSTDTLATICEDNRPFLWHGITCDTAGTYVDTLKTAELCDSVVTLHLAYQSAVDSTINDYLCPSSSYWWHGTELKTLGTYYDTIRSSLGCDSIRYVLQLGLGDTTTFHIDSVVCIADMPVTWQNMQIDAPGETTFRTDNWMGCDSVITFSLSVQTPSTIDSTRRICQGATLDIWDHSFTLLADTSFTVDTLHYQVAPYCDSLVRVLHVKIDSVRTELIQDTTCFGYEYVLYDCKSGQDLYTLCPKADTTLVDTVRYQSGCDSLIRTYNIKVLPVHDSVRTLEICYGDTVYISDSYGDFYMHTESGTYIDSLHSIMGCDSVVTLLLTVQKPTEELTNDYLCPRSVYTWREHDYNATGVYYDTLRSLLGCDSILYKLDLQMGDTSVFHVDSVVCESALPIIWNNLSIDQPGDYEFRTDNWMGCDSVITLSLAVQVPLDSMINDHLCPHSTYDWHGHTYTTAGTYYDTIRSALGCDSIRYVLDLQAGDTTVAHIDSVVCQANLPVIWEGFTIDAPGETVLRTTNWMGCDSIVTLSLSVQVPLDSTVNDHFCQGDSYAWHGSDFTAAGTYYDTIRSSLGCDSIRYTLNLTTRDTFNLVDSQSVCVGSYYLWHGDTLREEGLYTKQLTSVYGCDSVVTLSLTLAQALHVTDPRVICPGDSVIWNGKKYTEEGTDTFTYSSVMGCDSIVVLQISFADTAHTWVDSVICSGDSIEWGGQFYHLAGQYTKLERTHYGCDSLVTVLLSVQQPIDSAFNDYVCPRSSYDWRGQTLTSAGTYYDTIRSSLGCDSIRYSLVLSLGDTSTFHVDSVVCDGTLPIVWNNIEIDHVGNFEYRTTNYLGCDSVVTLTLTMQSPSAIDTFVRICQGTDVDMWGNTYTPVADTTYLDTLFYSVAPHCDSLYRTLRVKVDSVYTELIQDTTCSGYEYELYDCQTKATAFTFYPTQDTILIDTVRYQSTGCDSLIRQYQIKVLPVYDTLLTESICQGDTFFLSDSYGDVYAHMITGKYVDLLHSVSGCDSVVTLDLSVRDTFNVVDSQAICDGETYLWEGDSYTAAGSYTKRLTSIYGCDSVVTLNLMVNPTYTQDDNRIICQGEAVTWEGNSYTRDTTITRTLTTILGCDSVVTFTLTVNSVYDLTLETSICQGDTFRWEGEMYTIAGQYTKQLQSSLSCDSTVTINLAVRDTFNVVDNQSICQGDTFRWEGEEYTIAGQYTKHLSSIYGCDSVVTLNLSLLPIHTSDTSLTICQGDTFYVADASGHTFAHALEGVYVDSLRSILGCDSIVTVNLSVQLTVDSSFNDYICPLSTYDWRGRTLTAAGNYYDTIRSVLGCDSIRYSLALTMGDTSTSHVDTVVCDGMLPIMWNNIEIDQVGDFAYRTTNFMGCDSVATLTLSMQSPSSIDTLIHICQGFDLDLWGNTYSPLSDTVYVDTLLYSVAPYCDSLYRTLRVKIDSVRNELIQDTTCSGYEYQIYDCQTNTKAFTFYPTQDTMFVDTARYLSTGCDSLIRQYQITVLPVYDTILTENICIGDTFYVSDSHGTAYAHTLTGKYVDTLATVSGCDSIVTVNLAVRDTFNVVDSQAICDGETYLWEGDNYTAAGSYTKRLTSVYGCDSVVTLVLTVNPIYTLQDVRTACQGEVINWEGDNYTRDTVVTKTLSTIHTCDSVVTMTMTFLDTFNITDAQVFCEGDTFRWEGDEYDQPGQYQKVLTTVSGCDSVVTLVLTMNPITYSDTTVWVRPDAFPYSWYGQDYAAGDHQKTFQHPLTGCDSIVTLHVLTAGPTYGVDTISVCETELPYTWYTQQLTTEGDYQTTLFNMHGGDSILTLTFQIRLTTYGYDSLAICQSQLPYEWNGHTFTKAEITNVTITNVAGCDSVLTLNLHVNYPSAGDVDSLVCEQNMPITWNNILITSAGDYTFDTLNHYGCDSVATLHLTISPTDTATQEVLICESELPYAWNTLIAQKAGTYIDTLTNRFGCDSICTLVLTVEQAYTQYDSAEICQGDVRRWRGEDFFVSGDYARQVRGATACDSMFYFHLSVVDHFEHRVTGSICNGDTFRLADQNSEYIFTKSGSYSQTLTSSFGCDSIVYLTLIVNPVYYFEEEAQICIGEVFSWHGLEINEAGTYYDYQKTHAGCDSIYQLTMTTMPTTIIDLKETVCATEGYDFFSRHLTKSGIYRDSMRNEHGCLEVTVLDLTVVQPTVVQLAPQYICANARDEYMYIHYTYTGSAPTEYSIVFSEAAQKAGFQSILHAPIDEPGSLMAEVYTGQTIYDYPRPDDYTATVTLYDTICHTNATVDPYDFHVLYPSWIHEQHWNDAIALLNPDYNGHYEFTAVQWYENDEPLPGEVREYLYLPHGLVMGEKTYKALLTRKDDGKALFTCPMDTREVGDKNLINEPYVSVVPTYVHHINPFVDILTNVPGDYFLYDVTGKLLRQGSYVPDKETNTHRLELPYVSTMYILHIIPTDGEKRSIKITMN